VTPFPPEFVVCGFLKSRGSQNQSTTQHRMNQASELKAKAEDIAKHRTRVDALRSTLESAFHTYDWEEAGTTESTLVQLLDSSKSKKRYRSEESELEKLLRDEMEVKREMTSLANVFSVFAQHLNDTMYEPKEVHYESEKKLSGVEVDESCGHPPPTKKRKITPVDFTNNYSTLVLDIDGDKYDIDLPKSNPLLLQGERDSTGFEYPNSF